MKVRQLRGCLVSSVLATHLGDVVAHQTFNTRETAGATMATVVPGSPASTKMGCPDLFLEREASG